MSARWWTGGVWALVAASAFYWGFKVLVTAAPAPAHTQTAAAAPTTRADLGVVLGTDPPPPVAAAQAPTAASSRFQLIGVLSPRPAHAAKEGLALIAVDGKPPKAFRVGAVVDGANVLQSVATRGATLGPRDGAAMVALTLAPPTAAATGMLPNLASPPAPPLTAAPPGRTGARQGSGLAPVPGRPTLPPAGTEAPPQPTPVPLSDDELQRR